jgi:hypothetical protein
MADAKNPRRNAIARLGQLNAHTMKTVVEHGSWGMLTEAYVTSENEKALELATEKGVIKKDIIVAYEIDKEATDLLNSGIELTVDADGKYVRKTAVVSETDGIL